MRLKNKVAAHEKQHKVHTDNKHRSEKYGEVFHVAALEAEVNNFGRSISSNGRHVFAGAFNNLLKRLT